MNSFMSIVFNRTQTYQMKYNDFKTIKFEYQIKKVYL